MPSRSTKRRESANLRNENMRRAQKAGSPVGTKPEKPIGLKRYRKVAKKSASLAADARQKAGRRPVSGGRVNPR